MQETFELGVQDGIDRGTKVVDNVLDTTVFTETLRGVWRKRYDDYTEYVADYFGPLGA